MIKTITAEEAQFLLKILSDYVKYNEKNPDTRINRFFGLHSIKLYNLIKYFVVLNNVLKYSIQHNKNNNNDDGSHEFFSSPSSSHLKDIKPNELYDIKGSWIDRITNRHIESGKLLKDLDFRKTLKLHTKYSKTLFLQLRKDCAFLESQNIMDYSLLLAIYYVRIDKEKEKEKERKKKREKKKDSKSEHKSEDKNENKENESSSSIDYASSNANLNLNLNENDNVGESIEASIIEGPGVYDLGIIDVLQEWNNTKKLEKLFKVYLRCKDKHGISCVEPREYKLRFLRKMKSIGIGKRVSRSH